MRAPKDYSIFEKWYYLATLDLITCKDFVATPKNIAMKFRISEGAAARALKTLLENGLIEKTAHGFRKTEAQIRFPTTRSLPQIREYHRMIIAQGLENMLMQTSEAAFQQRLISSITFAMNPTHEKRGRERLAELIYEIADIMSDGDCTEVYQLNVQMFPLTDRSNVIPAVDSDEIDVSVDSKTKTNKAESGSLSSRQKPVTKDSE